MKSRYVLVKSIFRFAVVGIIGFVLNAGFLEFLARYYGPIYAQLMVFPVATTVTWYLNRHFTFGASDRSIGHEWLRYVIANILGWLIINGIYFLLILNFIFLFHHPSIALVVGALAGMVINFITSYTVVFDVAGRVHSD